MTTTIFAKMMCPSCRVEMNHHCDKVVYGADARGTAQRDESHGECVEEFHTCPRCGGVASRPAHA